MTTDIWSEADLIHLNDDDIKNFQEIVLKDVKNKNSSADEKTILNNNLDLWLYSLRVIRREIELQLSQNKTDLKMKIRDARDAQASQEELDNILIVEETWRNNAMKFLFAIERKTLYVKLLIDEDDIKD